MLPIGKNIIILGIIVFLAMNVWGLSSMSFDMNGKMMDCPFMSNFSSFCQMSLSEHISKWQEMFAMIRSESLFLFLCSLLVFYFVALGDTTRKRYNEIKFQKFRKYFYWYKPEIKLFDNFALAFSDGIIHSKIYEVAII